MITVVLERLGFIGKVKCSWKPGAHRAKDSRAVFLCTGPGADDDEDADDGGGGGANRISIGYGEALEDENGVLDLQNWSECVLCGEPVDNSWERCPTCGKKNPAGKN